MPKKKKHPQLQISRTRKKTQRTPSCFLQFWISNYKYIQNAKQKHPQLQNSRDKEKNTTQVSSCSLVRKSTVELIILSRQTEQTSTSLMDLESWKEIATNCCTIATVLRPRPPKKKIKIII
jgi:hypothetical protein